MKAVTNSVIKTAIIVLGGPNNNDGSLSLIAKSRCEQAYQTYLKMPAKILCTGGFGAHFNTTNHAHGEYTKRYLIELGIPESAFLPVALSRFTFEDALLTKPLLAAENITAATLVSSEFHIARVHYVFSHVQPNLELTLVSAKTPLSEIKLAQLYAHERAVMPREVKNVQQFIALQSQKSR